MPKKQQECSYHLALHIDCDRYSMLWYALTNFRNSQPWEPSELKDIDAMLKELDEGIHEK